MFQFWQFFLLTKIYIPHGHCYLWQPFLVSLHLVSDALISLSYYFIPIALLRLLNQRRDTPFRVVWFLFAAFIVTCGTTHFLSIVTLWYPIYWISGLTKALTAIVSMITAFQLISIIPQALALPSPTQLQILNQELEEKTQFLQSIYEGVEQGIFVINVEENQKFRYLSYNPAAEKLSGFYTSEIKGKTPDEFMPIASANLSIQQFQACVRAKKSITVEECLYFQGKNSWFLTTLTPLKDRQGNIKQIIGTATDINQRKQAEQKLQESEERFRSAFDDAAIGMALVSLEGNFFKVNQSLCELTGYQQQELLSLTVQQITHPEDLEIDLNYAKQLVAGEIRTYQMEKRYFHKNGEIVWIQLNVSLVRNGRQEPLYFIAQIQDINERKQAEIGLQESQERLYRTLEAGRIICWEEDLITQRVKGWGENIADNWKATFWEFPLEFAPQGIHPEDRDRAVEAKENAIKNKGEFQVEHRLVGFPENTWMLAKGKAIVNSQGKVTRVVGVAIDISDRKATEAELVKAKEAAEVANQAKSIFLANMSHELRSPLNAILGFSQLLNGSSNLTPEQQNNLNIIQRSGEHLLSLINEILDLSKIEAGRTILIEEAFDLWELVEEIQDLFRLKASQKNLQFFFILNPNLPRYIKSDRVKLRQILVNLLSNAIKFTRQGTVTLEANVSENSPVCLIDSETSGVELHFKVSDTGVGIESEELDYLFQPFVQTQSGIQSQQGTGLGLAICQGYIKLFGGRIEVNSQPEVGTTFEVKVTVMPVDSAESIPEIYSENRVIGLQPNQPRYRILIVDDEAYNRQLLEQILASVGFELQTANNGLEAVRKWQSFQPHLIWMDLKMPVLDGYEATRQIRLLETQSQASGSSRTVIIALTASAYNYQKEAALQADCDDFLQKPLQIGVILNKITEHLKVQYLYEEFSRPSQTVCRENDLSHIQSELATLSPNWKFRLTEALLSLDAEEINRLITEIIPEKEELANYLKYHTDNFNYESILKLIEAEEED
ncbi:MAG: PAS domain S-box protein [Lyngbya sp.]|nr:PAS domain S-box protein [Lyngbya sp.]